MSKMIIKECDICCEKINKSTRRAIKCSYDECGSECCAMCYNIHLLNSTLNPTCMFCNKDVSLDDVWSVSTEKFYKEYIEYRTLIILVREKSLIPTSQHLAEAILKNRKIKILIENMAEDIHKLSSKIYNIKYTLKQISIHMELKIKFRTLNYDLLNSIAHMYWIDSMETRCVICDRNNYGQKSYTCVKCNFKSCVECFKLCLTQKKNCCLVCDEPITDDMIDIVPKTFYNKYIKDKKITKRTKIINVKNDKIVELIMEKIEVNNKISELALIVYKYKNNSSENTKKDEEKKFIKACPANECRGFLSSAYKCGICEKFFCSDCEIEKVSRNDEDHVCNEDIKASIAMLKKNTRPCPKCSTPIEKSEGCDQMYCIVPNCKTAFSWKTGKIDKGIIHNPEYYRQQRELNNGEIPRNVGDNPCGGVPEYHDVGRKLRLNNINNIHWAGYHQLINHIRFALIRDLPTDIANVNYEDLRVKYIVGDIDEEKWKKNLKIKIKKSEKDFNIYQILDMYVHASTDLFLNLMHDLDIQLFVDNSTKLIKYTDEQIERINKRYKSRESKYFLKNNLINY